MKYIYQVITVTVLLFTGFLSFQTTVHASEAVADQSAQLSIFDVRTDNRIAKLRGYLASLNSPMVYQADHFVAEADRFSLDWRLVPAIAGLESTYGKRVPKNTYNAWGWGIPTPDDRGIAFSDWENGISTVTEGLKENYVDRGAQSVEQIGRRYASSPTWAVRVRHIMTEIEHFTPRKPSHLLVTI